MVESQFKHLQSHHECSGPAHQSSQDVEDARKSLSLKAEISRKDRLATQQVLLQQVQGSIKVSRRPLNLGTQVFLEVFLEVSLEAGLAAWRNALTQACESIHNTKISSTSALELV